MGSSDFAIPALEALAKNHEIVGVYSQPPRPAGRGKKPRPTPVARWVHDVGGVVRCPKDLCGPCVQKDFMDLDAELGVVVSYGLVIPSGLLGVPRFGFLNIHPSLLPRWRGAAPLRRAIMHGDAFAGVCIVEVVEKLDAGPVLLRERTPIYESDTAESLSKRTSSMGADLILEAILRLGELRPESQQDEGITYAKKIEKSEVRVDWSRSAAEIDGQIRGLSPFPGARSEVLNIQIKLLDCRLASGEGTPGEILDDAFTVACGTGAVSIRRAQRPGRKPMDAAEFLRGFPMPRGNRFTA